MKKPIFVLMSAAVLCAVPSQGSASDGTITIYGAVVNSPCEQSAKVLADYASNPRRYALARKSPPNPSCADINTTLSITATPVKTSTDSKGKMITVVYN